MSRTRAVTLVWVLLSLWSGGLYVRAALDPPPGRVFIGTFHWVDDFYNYASYVRQAEDGALLFRNRLLEPSRSRPELLNLEWWLVGRVSLALGRHPFLAYRLFALVTSLALVVGVERWLSRLGLPDSHRFLSLVLVFLGGGLGGLLFELTDRPVWRCLDMSVAFFPFLEILANPHFAAGTALLVWSLWAFAALPGRGGPLLGIALGTVLGLVRPYDVGLLVAIRCLAVVATEPPGRWVRRVMPLLGLGPVLGYDVWLFFGSEQFASFRAGASFPARADFLPALGPALAVALLGLWAPGPTPEARAARAHMWAWTAVGLCVVLARSGSFSLQFLVGTGLPLLALGAAGLARHAPSWTALAALGLSTSALVSTRVALTDDPNWFVPRERMATAEILRDDCRAGDLVLAPPDIGLYAIGLSRCDAVLAHPAVPGYEARLAAARAFYASRSPDSRSAFLDQQGVTHLVLPGSPGWRPVGWLGEGTLFRAVARVGAGPNAMTVYARPRPRAVIGGNFRHR
jgi:hypothetical protein